MRKWQALTVKSCWALSVPGASDVRFWNCDVPPKRLSCHSPTDPSLNLNQPPTCWDGPLCNTTLLFPPER